MRGDKNLAPLLGIISKLFSQFRLKFRVKLIFRLFDTQQGMRFRIVEQYQIGEHLDGAVRDIAVNKWIGKSAILKAEQQAPVLSWNRLDIADAGYAPLHCIDNLPKNCRAIFIDVSSHQLQIIPCNREVFAKTRGIFAAPCQIDMKIGHMPVFNENSEGAGRFEAFKLSQSLDRQDILADRLFFSFQFFVRLVEILLIGNGLAAALREVQKMIGETVATAFVA